MQKMQFNADKLKHNARMQMEKKRSMNRLTHWQLLRLFHYSHSNSISINPKRKWNLIESLPVVQQLQAEIAAAAAATIVWSKSPWNRKNWIYNCIKMDMTLIEIDI